MDDERYNRIWERVRGELNEGLLRFEDYRKILSVYAKAMRWKERSEKWRKNYGLTQQSQSHQPMQ